MIYGIFMMSFIEKNNINRVHLENSCVGTNYDSVYPCEEDMKRAC